MSVQVAPVVQECWVLSNDCLFADVVGIALVERQIFGKSHFLHPKQLKDQLFRATVEPDCLIIDGDSFSEQSEVALVIGLVEKYLPDSHLIIFCQNEQWPFLHFVIRHGVRGVVLKSQGVDEIRAVVDAVRDGNAKCPMPIAAATLNEIRRLAMQKGEANSTCHLTKREVEVLEYVAQNLANKEISKVLGLSVSTIKNHLHNIFEKLECHSRQTAVRNAIAFGFLSCSNTKVFE